mmetsp:Transcript_16355/g.27658  ORF Transcript_16355/g.27658 Transcript_16355/m.27658 type:complete len:138 (-) Transcript_16355:889-1302(-)
MKLNQIKKILLVRKSITFDRLVGINRDINTLQNNFVGKFDGFNGASVEEGSKNTPVNRSKILFENFTNQEEKKQEIRGQHDTIVESFCRQLEASGRYEIDLKNEVDLTYDDTADKDLCISIGGDNTFLKTAIKMNHF